MIQPKTLTVSITRTVKRGCEMDFEKSLHEFVQRSLALPGQHGVHIVRPAPGSDSREYGIIRKFASREALAVFRTSPEYLAWNQVALDLTEGSGRVEELNGLESWFTLPGALLQPLPKWKMAIVTFLGVYPVVMLLRAFLGSALQSWNFFLNNAAFNACVVILLTWVVMPLLTRFLRQWLHPQKAP
ncbi:MAG TPA: antibiotic biosynthesis monooxygenase [Verrucomicrobiae bacterium]|jgi:hypothetical protein|nr:antibiotic biosynthesis monooxygenase [Verrucomicrobiae bacterium]